MTKKVRRVVLGTGHPWFHSSGSAGNSYDSVQLTAEKVANSILLRGGEKTVSFQFSDVGNWNKVRLVLEVLD